MSAEASQLSLVQLDTVLTVVDRGSFTAAARALHRAQPAVSRQVAQVEKVLGLMLLDRGPHHVRVHAHAEGVIDAIRRTLEAARGVHEAAAAVGRGDRGDLVIATLRSGAPAGLLEVLTGFRTASPHVRVRIAELDDRAQVTAVRDGLVDVALARGIDPVGDLASEELAVEQLHAVLPVWHRLAAQPHLTLSELADERVGFWPDDVQPSGRAWLAARLREYGHSGDLLTATMSSIMAMIAAGSMVSVLVPSYRRVLDTTGVVFVPLDGMHLRLTLLSRHGDPNPSVALYRATARNWADEQARSGSGV